MFDFDRGDAGDYDLHAHVQRRVAAELLAFVGEGRFRSILEPGCGTGLYTGLLVDAFPGARIEAVDLSPAMLEVARRRLRRTSVTLREGDAEVHEGGPYELVTSSSALQWYRDLPGSLARHAQQLVPGGRIAAAIFGPATFGELDGALRAVFGDGVRVRASRFRDRGEVLAALARSFRDVELVERRYVEALPSLRELLLSIRRTGTRGDGAGPRPAWTPRTYARVEERLRDGDAIPTTYQVFYARGER